jgi:hypothetical protein
MLCHSAALPAHIGPELGLTHAAGAAWWAPRKLDSQSKTRTADVADEGQEALHGGAVLLGPHPPVDLLAQVEQQVVYVAWSIR